MHIIEDRKEDEVAIMLIQFNFKPVVYYRINFFFFGCRFGVFLDFFLGFEIFDGFCCFYA